MSFTAMNNMAIVQQVLDTLTPCFPDLLDHKIKLGYLLKSRFLGIFLRDPDSVCLW